MVENKKEKRVPNLRFEGFTDDWMQRLLKSEATFSKGKGYRKKDLISEGYPIILYGEMYTNYQEFIDNVNTYVANDSKAIKSNGHEVIVPSSGESPDDIVRASSIGKEGIILGGDLNIIHPSQNINSDFLALSISNGDSKRELRSKAQGSSITHLYNSDIEKIKIYYPDLSEQIKIVKVIRLINNIITLEQEKIDLYKKLKNGFLQNLFPQKDSFSPQFRFKGFSDIWENKKLKDILKKGNKNRVDNPEEYKRLTVKLHKKGLEKFNVDRKMANTRPFYQRFSGELIIGKQNYFNGSLAIVSNDFDGYICSNAIMSFSVPYDNTNYIYNFIGRDSYINKRSHLANGTGQKELSEKSFLNFNISMPSLSEQQKIGDLLKEIDDLITLKNEKVTKYKQIKTYLLQNMFV